MKTIFKSSTAMVLIASLAMPIPALSQDIDFDTTGMTQEQIEEELLRLQRLAEEAERESMAEAEAEGDPEADAQMESDAETEVEAEAEAEAQTDTETNDAPESNSSTEATVEAEADANADAETTSEQETGDGTGSSATAETDSEASGSAAATEAEAETETDAESATQAETGDTSQDSSEAETTAETAPADDAEGETETGTTDVDSQAEAEGEADADTATTQEPTAEDSAEDTTTSAPEDGRETDDAQATQADPEPMSSDAQAEAQAQADTDAPASMAAAAGDTDAAEVTEESVTEDTSRSSSEEFETDLDGEALREEADDDDDSGLSNFEKFAILGLGAVALSQILRPDEEVVTNTGDRVVVERDGQYRLLKNDDSLLRRPGSDVTTYQFEDGSTRTVVVREDGAQVETIRARDGRVLRRTRVLADGREVILFDDTQASSQVIVNDLPQISDRRQVSFRDVSAEDLAVALSAQDAQGLDRRFSLSQVRNIDAVRDLVPQINVDTINFETNSAVIQPDEARELSALGRAMSQIIEDNPGEVFLIEGHTDAVGGASYNLALSDRRAESVALALTEYFDVPPENLVVQGYGESDLLVRSDRAERANRRAAVRRITPLLQER